jgi:uncharacterized protein (TIGR03086 family)
VAAETAGPAATHREVAGGFTSRVVGVRDWEAPAPPEGWVARDVVRHLLEWFPPFLERGSGVRLPPGPSVDEDPVAAWRAHAGAVQAVLDDPDVAGGEFAEQHVGTMTVADAVDRFYTGDVFLHTWDLARATGQDERLDPDRCAVMFEGMQPYDAALRASGHYGPRVEVPDDADVQTRLLAFIGRDPADPS